MSLYPLKYESHRQMLQIKVIWVYILRYVNIFHVKSCFFLKSDKILDWSYM